MWLASSGLVVIASSVCDSASNTLGVDEISGCMTEIKKFLERI